MTFKDKTFGFILWQPRFEFCHRYILWLNTVGRKDDKVGKEIEAGNGSFLMESLEKCNFAKLYSNAPLRRRILQFFVSVDDDDGAFKVSLRNIKIAIFCQKLAAAVAVAVAAVCHCLAVIVPFHLKFCFYLLFFSVHLFPISESFSLSSVCWFLSIPTYVSLSVSVLFIFFNVFLSLVRSFLSIPTKPSFLFLSLLLLCQYLSFYRFDVVLYFALYSFLPPYLYLSSESSFYVLLLKISLSLSLSSCRVWRISLIFCSQQQMFLPIKYINFLPTKAIWQVYFKHYFDWLRPGLVEQWLQLECFCPYLNSFWMKKAYQRLSSKVILVLPKE